MAEFSPMMKQYFEVKERNKDALLFYRVGDFYEMFFDDAITASKELDLTLTGKDCGQEERAPMCGVPFHSCEPYIAKLVQKGYKVAICEQTEDPAKAKGLVKRDIIRVVTPGTVIEPTMLDETQNSYIGCIYCEKGIAGLAFCDTSTGEFVASTVKGKDIIRSIKDELLKFSPKEILISTGVLSFKELVPFLKEKIVCSVEVLDDTDFDEYDANETLKKHFDDAIEDMLGNSYSKESKLASAALLGYLERTQMTGLERITKIIPFAESEYISLDFSAKRNLELTETLHEKKRYGSLLWVLDKCETSMGKRLLKSFIEKPLVNVGKITRRQNAVAELFDNVQMRIDLRDALGGIPDIERIMTKIVYGSANARDLISLLSAFNKLPEIKEAIKNSESTLMKEQLSELNLLEDLKDLIEGSIVESPPFSVREGGIIKEGCNKELDELRYDMNNSAELLSGIESRERERTGIPKLKVGYNRVFGYYIEVTNLYKDSVPNDYIRKQTLTNCERYITEELKEVERRILGAKERSFALEYTIFEEIRKQTAKHIEQIESTARAVAMLDTLASLAQTAYDNNYCQPDITQNGKIIIKDGRHPVVERLLKTMPFVPNDVTLDSAENRVAIITGPNMAGKSTYMRSVALIVLMAQIGSFVPAKSAEISICDSIFTRIGASDDMTTGQSTFMVEMNEVAYILKNATKDSLLILDEIGRGTSTFDGMSIARAVLEFVADKKKLGAKTLFATHYHELTVLEDDLDGVKNYNIAVKKRGDDITFLRRIVRGAADDSYGVEVAKLAGLPASVINRAKLVLKELECGKNDAPKKQAESEETEEQLSLVPEADEIREMLRSTDINTLTPIEAMNVLVKLIALAEK